LTNIVSETLQQLPKTKAW